MGHHHSSPAPTTVVNNGTVFNPHATNDAVVNANNIGLQNLLVLSYPTSNVLQNLNGEDLGGNHQAVKVGDQTFYYTADQMDSFNGGTTLPQGASYCFTTE